MEETQESSSDGSADKEEIMRNFDEEAKLIVQTAILPTKSADRYMLVYNTYKNWKETKKNVLSGNKENNLIVYFEELKAKLKPPTLWSIWSMLKSTSNVHDDINITNFFKLKSIIKTNSKSYKPKKSSELRWHQIIKFMNDAPDHIYLVLKVVLIFGICGCLRCDELKRLEVGYVEDLSNMFLVRIGENKNDYCGQFIIGTLFYDKVKKYISLRPANTTTNSFFIKYQAGKCFNQNIGKHNIGQMPHHIASFLQLPNAKTYTGHCYRRTSTTLLADSGANMQLIKQLGRRRSDVIAQGYIENSLHNRQLIFDGVIQHTKTLAKTSTNTNVNPQHQPDNHDDLNVNWADFEDDFNVENTAPISDNFNAMVESDFSTAKKNQILIPAVKLNRSDLSTDKKFYKKPGIKVNFINESNAKSSMTKKRKIEDLKDENCNEMGSTFRKRDSKFDNCTFNNCVFNIHPQCCDKNEIS